MRERARASKNIPAEMTRAVPVEMLGDPDFLNILKEQARKSAPDSGTDESEYYSQESKTLTSNETPPPPPPPKTKRGKQHRENKRRQERLTKAAMNPACIIDPHDRELIPQIERRIADRQERKDQASRIYRREPVEEPTVSKNVIFGIEMPEWFGLKMYVVATLVVFILLIVLKRNLMTRKLGFTYALVAELPFLAAFLSGFSGVPAQQMIGEIKQFERGIHPVLNPNPLQQQPPPPPTITTQPPTPTPPAQPTRQPITPSTPAVEQQQTEKEQTPGLSPQEERQQTIELLRDEALAWAEEERGDGEEDDKKNSDEETDEEEEEVPKEKLKINVPAPEIQRGKPVVIKNTLSRSQAKPYKEPPKPKPQDPVATPIKPSTAKTVESEPKLLKTKRAEKPSDIGEIPGVSRGKEARELSKNMTTTTKSESIPGVTKTEVAKAFNNDNDIVINMNEVDE